MIIQQRKPRRAGIGIAASAVAMLVGLVFGPALPAMAAPGDLRLASTSDGGMKGDGSSQLRVDRTTLTRRAMGGVRIHRHEPRPGRHRRALRHLREEHSQPVT